MDTWPHSYFIFFNLRKKFEKLILTEVFLKYPREVYGRVLLKIPLVSSFYTEITLLPSKFSVLVANLFLDGNEVTIIQWRTRAKHSADPESKLRRRFSVFLSVCFSEHSPIRTTLSARFFRLNFLLRNICVCSPESVTSQSLAVLSFPFLFPLYSQPRVSVDNLILLDYVCYFVNLEFCTVLHFYFATSFNNFHSNVEEPARFCKINVSLKKKKDMQGKSAVFGVPCSSFLQCFLKISRMPTIQSDIPSDIPKNATPLLPIWILIFNCVHTTCSYFHR